MKRVKGLSLLLLGALTAGAVHAAEINRDCDGLLTGAPQSDANQFEFAISDLEGLYLEIVADAGKLALMSKPDTRAIETFLKKKAQFLNDVGPIIGDMQTSPSVNLGVLHMMIVSLGAPGEAYGFVADKEGKIQFAAPVHLRAQANGHFQDPVKIGFEDHSAEPSDSILTPNLTIGFGPQTIVPGEQPRRHGGLLAFAQHPRSEEVLVVIDKEDTSKAYLAPKQILTAMGASTEEKAMSLEFERGKGWFIAFANLLNPEGKIGF